MSAGSPSNISGGEEDGEAESEGPEKWQKNSMWPQQLWHPCAPLDPASMYDGRRRDGRKELVIPGQVEVRNDQLQDYIHKHRVTT